MAEAVVLEMGFVWNPIHIESGIDAIIEFRDPATGETKNKILQVQVKAVTNFAAEQDDAFSFSCERAHIGYWMGGTARVILIVCRPASGEIYWKDIHSYFSLPENQERCTVRFSKTKDRFDSSVRSALMGVAKPEGGLALGPLPKREILGINLIPLAYPDEIFSTPTKGKSWDEFFSALRELKKPWLQEFIWEAGTLFSFFDPGREGIEDICEAPSRPFPSSNWAQSQNPVFQRHFAELLGKAFEQRCFKQGVRFDRESRIFFFSMTHEGAELKIATKSQVNTTSKTVISKHSSPRPDGTISTYFKHWAFDGRMRHFGEEWYFELTPTFRFTEDGKVEHPNSHLLLAGIKRMERHPAVRSQFLAWKEFLTEDSLFNASYRFLDLLVPEALSIDRGIDDDSWRPPAAPEEIPAVTPESVQAAVEPDVEDEGDLFSWKRD